MYVKNNKNGFEEELRIKLLEKKIMIPDSF